MADQREDRNAAQGFNAPAKFDSLYQRAVVSFPFNVPISEQAMTDIVALKSAKLLVRDKALGLGTTDPLAEFASVTSNLVVSFYFAKRGFENVARIIKR
jgi:hypothetical protein